MSEKQTIEVGNSLPQPLGSPMNGVIVGGSHPDRYLIVRVDCDPSGIIIGSPCAVSFGECAWVEDDDGNWKTQCGEFHVFTDGGPSDNNYRFCPYCGKKLANNVIGATELRITPEIPRKP